MNERKVTRKDLIKSVAKSTGNTYKSVRAIFDTLENKMIDELTAVDKENPIVTICLFNGLSILGKYQPEQEKELNFNHENSVIEERIAVRPYMTRHFQRKFIRHSNNR